MDGLKFCASFQQAVNSKSELKNAVQLFNQNLNEKIIQGKFRSIPGIIFHAWAITGHPCFYPPKMQGKQISIAIVRPRLRHSCLRVPAR